MADIAETGDYNMYDIIFGIMDRDKHLWDFGDPDEVIAFLRENNFESKVNSKQLGPIRQEIQEYEEKKRKLKDFIESKRDAYFTNIPNRVFNDIEDIKQDLKGHFLDGVKFSDDMKDIFVYVDDEKPDIKYLIDKEPIRKQVNVKIGNAENRVKVDVQIKRIITNDGYGILISNVSFFKQAKAVEFSDNNNVLVGGIVNESKRTQEDILELLVTDGSIEDRYRSMLEVYDGLIEIGRNKQEQKESLIAVYDFFKKLKSADDDKLKSYKKMMSDGENGKGSLIYDGYIAVAPRAFRAEWKRLLMDIIDEEIKRREGVRDFSSIPEYSKEKQEEYEKESRLRKKETKLRKRFFDWCRSLGGESHFANINKVQTNWIHYYQDQAEIKMIHADENFFEQTALRAISIEKGIPLKNGTNIDIFVQTSVGTVEDKDTGKRTQVIYYSNFREVQFTT